jgi:hypothetical protein
MRLRKVIDLYISWTMVCSAMIAIELFFMLIVLAGIFKAVSE